MVEKQLLKLSKSAAIGNDYEIKNGAACVVDDTHLVCLYNLQAMQDRSKPSLLQLNLFDVRQIEETESHEVCWPYQIKSLEINPVKRSILIIS